MLKEILLAAVYVVILGIVAWLCERFRPAIVLGGILLLIVVLT